MEARVKVGCCGFRSSRSAYFEKFDIVEVQHTFYEPPQISTLERWRSEAPQDFEFIIKAWQRITHLGTSPTYRRQKSLSDEDKEFCGHFQPTEVVADAMAKTLQCAEALRASKILFQCPPSFTPDEENVENLRLFFRRFKPKKGIQYLWEPRGKWPEAMIYEVAEELGLVHVVNPYKDTPVTAGLHYFRIHGRTGQQVYSDSELEELRETVEYAEDAYVLFNNIYMIQDAARFKTLLRQERKRK